MGWLPVTGSKDILHPWSPNPGRSLGFIEKKVIVTFHEIVEINYDKRCDDAQNHSSVPIGAGCLVPEFHSCNLH